MFNVSTKNPQSPEVDRSFLAMCTRQEEFGTAVFESAHEPIRTPIRKWNI